MKQSECMDLAEEFGLIPKREIPCWNKGGQTTKYGFKCGFSDHFDSVYGNISLVREYEEDRFFSGVFRTFFVVMGRIDNTQGEFKHVFEYNELSKARKKFNQIRKEIKALWERRITRYITIV